MRPPPGLGAGAAPALLALLFGTALGGFWQGAAAGPAAAGYALLLAIPLVLAVSRSRNAERAIADPWRLGSPALVVPWALLATTALAAWASPVPRAGRVGIALLPALLWLPAVVAHGWRTASARRWAGRAFSLAVGGVSAVALGFWLSGAVERPSLPVGQHLHLTVWLALLLPLAALPWREGGGWRAVAATAVALGAAAVLGTRTLSGLLALGVEAVLAVRWAAPRRHRAILAAAATLALAAVGAVEIRAVLTGTDPSGAARFVYWRAGWDGVLERPVTGAGPGSTAWTLPLSLRPVPGVNPPSEVVGELHLLPLTVAYEIGLPGLLLAATAVTAFVARRRLERSSAADPGFVSAGLAGLAGGGAAGLATGDWRVLALPVAAALTAGAALAGGAREPDGERARGRGWSGARTEPPVYALAALVWIAPVSLAHAAFDRAVDAPPQAALAALDRAVRHDPAFPLYRARRAWLAGELEAPEWPPPRVAAEAVRAAEDALGVPALWLAGGAAAEAAGNEWAAALAYERACAADPLGAFAPFALARIGSPLHDPAAVAARAFAAEPRLAAATWWIGREALLRRAALRLATTEGLDEGWREALRTEAEALVTQSTRETEPRAELALVVDARPAESLSLHAFRRRPWPARLLPVEVAESAARKLGTLPPAVVLETTDPRLFPRTCTGDLVLREVGTTPFRRR